MRKILTLVLLLSFACSEETEFQCESCIHMTISDALPIQFWKNDCPTYNEKESCGVHSFCWNKKFDCDDEIRLQIKTDGDGESASIVDGDASDFENSSNGNDDWNPATAFIAFSTDGKSATEALMHDFDVPAGSYPFSYNVSYSGSFTASGTVRIGIVGLDEFGVVQTSLSDVATIVSGASNTVSGTLTFSPIAPIKKIGWIIQISGTKLSGLIEATVNDFYITSENYALEAFDKDEDKIFEIPFELSEPLIYGLSFIPSNRSPEICNEGFTFKIVKSGSEIIAKSDFIEFSSNLDCTQLIKYRNERAFAGIDYPALNSEDYFYLRIPAVFFHEQFPGEDEAIELSDSKIINLNGVLRAQKLLDTDYMPYYIHKKIQLILKHQFVEIEGTRWTKQGAYEIADGNKKYPLKKATCWLTERNFVARNVV